MTLRRALLTIAVKVAGNPAYAIRYAQRDSLDRDSSLVTLVSDRVLVVGSDKTTPPPLPVTIIRLTLSAKNQGGGWLCAPQAISYDPVAKRISGACDDPNELILQSMHQVVFELPR